MGSTGDSYDNALAEALNSLCKAELIYNEARPGYAPVARSERSNAKPPPGSTGTTPAAPTSPWGITLQQAENQHTTTRKEVASTSLRKTQD